jgi:hypothetical protein
VRTSYATSPNANTSAAAYKLHDEEGRAALGDPDVDNRDEVRVVYARADLGFASEAGRHRARHLARDELEGEALRVGDALDLEDGSHAACAERAHDAVARVEPIAWSRERQGYRLADAGDHVSQLARSLGDLMATRSSRASPRIDDGASWASLGRHPPSLTSERASRSRPLSKMRRLRSKRSRAQAKRTDHRRKRSRAPA